MADPAGRDATAPEVEAVAQAFGYTPSMKRMWPEALEKAAAAIAALDRVRADSARGEDHEAGMVPCKGCGAQQDEPCLLRVAWDPPHGICDRQAAQARPANDE